MENTTPRLQAFFKEIWPTIYRIVNGGLFFLLRLLKGSVKMAVEQLTKW